jgi:hypothetical protein
MPSGNSIVPQGKGPLLKIRTKAASVEDFVARHARDFGAQGVFVVTRRPLDVGAPVGVEFQLVDGQPVFACRGTVAWKRDPSEDAARSPGMGVNFGQLGADAIDLLSRLTQHRGATASRFDAEIASPSATLGARTTTRPARGLWTAPGNSPVPPATPGADAAAAAGAGDLRASQLFSSPDLAPAARAEAVEVDISVAPAPTRIATPSLSELEPESDAPASDALADEPDALRLPDLPSSGGAVAGDAPRSSDPARAKRFSGLIRALRTASTPPDEPAPHDTALLGALILAGGLIVFTVYLFGTGTFAPLLDTLTRGLKTLAAQFGF